MAPPLHVCEGSPDPYANVTSDVIMGFHEDCPFPDCTMCLLRNGDKEMSLGTMMERTLEQFGTLQNKTMTAYAYLNFDWFHKDDKLPVKSARVYKVVYRCNDDQTNMWCVASIQDVTDLPPSELPQAFKDWEIGRENANVAPFDLSDVDRKVWYVQNEGEWTRNVEEDAHRVARLAEEHADDDDFEPEEYANYSGPHPGKSALFLFARASCPAIMTTPADGYADVPELKELLRQSITKFETLVATERQVWDGKAAEDMQRYKQENEESGDY
jgi:hypothetical protein